MGLIELLGIAVGLSMDAFAVAVCKGLSNKRIGFVGALTVGLYFGVFQALMPLIGYLAGSQFKEGIEAYDHWIAFVLLAVIGGKMLKEGLETCPEGEEQGADGGSLSPKSMLPLAIATSIDALAVGVSFAFLNIHIAPAVSLIGVTTFLLSIGGVYTGKMFGLRFKSKAEVLGGSVLILIGLKILLEHLGVFG